MRLVSELLSSGASAAVQDGATGNTPLLLAVKLGGAAGLAVARLLLPGLQGKSSSSEEACTTCSINATNGAGETALALAAASALGAAGSTSGSTGSTKPGSAPAAIVDGNREAALDMLSLILAHNPAVPADLGASLLVSGLTGTLPDSIAAQVC